MLCSLFVSLVEEINHRLLASYMETFPHVEENVRLLNYIIPSGFTKHPSCMEVELFSGSSVQIGNHHLVKRINNTELSFLRRILRVKLQPTLWDEKDRE